MTENAPPLSVIAVGPASFDAVDGTKPGAARNAGLFTLVYQIIQNGARRVISARLKLLGWLAVNALPQVIRFKRRPLQRLTQTGDPFFNFLQTNGRKAQTQRGFVGTMRKKWCSGYKSHDFLNSALGKRAGMMA